MRMRAGACALLLCAGCAPAPEVTTATLSPRSLPSCAPSQKLPLVVRAIGDFASASERAASGTAVSTLDGLPSDTRFVALETAGKDASGTAFGGLFARGDGDQQSSLLLLPLDANRSCPLGDPFAVAAPGAAVAPLPGGGLLIAGGSDGQGASLASAVVLRPGEILVDAVPSGMLVARAGASATQVGSRVVIAGGSEDDAAPATGTYEVYDAVRGVFDKDASERLQGDLRRDHGAVRLGDGRVLIAGGCRKLGTASATRPAGPGANPVPPRCLETRATPLASGELIDLAGGSHAIKGELLAPRVKPQLLALDDGSVVVALGWDGAGKLVASLERFDPKRELFSPAGALPEHAFAAVAALEGNRIAYLGCDGPGAGCELRLMLPDGDRFVDAGELFLQDTLEQPGLRDLSEVSLLALPDGRLLAAGHAEAAVIARRGFLIDLNQPAILTPSQERAEQMLTRLADHLLMLEDGTRIELNATGMSFGRSDTLSPLDPPASRLIAQNALGVALDSPLHWQVGNKALIALAPARFDLPRLRFADVAIELELAGGSGELLLEPEGAPPLSVSITRGALAVSGCEPLAISGEPALVTIERSGAQLRLRAPGGSRRCDAAMLEGRVGIALRVDADTELRAFRVTRR